MQAGSASSPPSRTVSASLGQRLLETAIRGWLGFALRTTRWRFEATPQARALLLQERGDGRQPGLLVAFWHEALALSPALWWWTEPRNPSMRLHVLISRNNDGRLIARIVTPWRIPPIHGSSDKKGKNKGGAAALRQIRQVLAQGHTVAVMPDGPKGPRRVIQPGILALAEKSGIPILPVGVQCTCLRASSWDRMILPLPFGRGRIVCGEPVHVKPGEREAAGQTLTLRLTTAQDEAGQPADTYPDTLASMPAQSVAEGPARIPSEPNRAAPARPPILWSILTSLLAPGLVVMLRVRVRRGKEISSRTRERLGFAAMRRPDGPLIWIHAASVGETLSVIPVIRIIMERPSAPAILVTTGTVTAAAILTRELPEAMQAGRIRHSFVPLDVPRWIRRFLHEWRPDGLVLTESELWPNMIGACNAAGLPVMLVNGRLSRSALTGWRKLPRMAGNMMSALSWIAARSPEDAARFRMLGASNVFCDGDLKTAAPPLAADATALDAARKAIGERPVWIAASTHPGEEKQILDAAKILRKAYPDLLTIIAPRHPERGAAIAEEVKAAFPSQDHTPRRSQGEWSDATAPVWIVDTLGELGILFRLSRIVFMGNSLIAPDIPIAGGGHNPLEPARLGCAILTGPAIDNFEEAFAALGDAVSIVHSAQELANRVKTLLDDPIQAEELGRMGERVATRDRNLPTRLADLICRTCRTP
ncbi:MAG: glycosyltransferase N-terminal domain-containing protein [Acetobacter aceti]|uniref:3-deoxy-D-manno-octulosonic acid transferase n=1 Tax=Acetobacter aceti TaxID=435 RepID=A0A1U9KEY7_ACEAC|nr:glycosyltransferase N-terminal domain-containing protein [Acetobacter aceti]AQS84373.1 3-deoxy-D-manno-octulosonic acid transferase [Acetobacter aceti]